MLTDSEGDYPPILRIGDYRVEAAMDEISCDGVVCKLEPRGMSLLLCLARHAGQVVSVDRLLEEVWKDVVVNPDSVYQTVATLRRALRDDAKDPQYIANVVRRGYRLIAPVSVWGGSGTASSTVMAVPVVVTGQGERAEVRIAESPAAPLPRLAVPRSHASIAILPFANLTGDPTKEHLGDGIAEELINTLTRAPGWFKVVARTSAFAYKGRHIDVRQIAKDLDVEAVLEGSVRSADERIRITAQLVDGRTGHDIWSRSYERKLTNWFDLQSELTVSIADALTIGGGSGLSAADGKSPTLDLQAFQFVLQAKSLGTQPTEHNLRSALEFLARATERDPMFARAWQGMAVTRGYHFVTMDYLMPDALKDAEQCAHRALALDASLPARAVLGFINACRGQWIKAEAEIRASLSMLPNDPEIHLVHSIYVAQSAGHLWQAMKEAEVACRLAPLTPVDTFNVGLAQLRVGQNAEALKWIQRAIADGMPETVGPVSDTLAHLAQHEQRYEEAAVHMMNALSPAWRAAGAVDAVTLFYSALVQPSGNEAAVSALRRLEAGLRAEDFGQINSKRLIMWYTNLGALDFAYEAADRALERFALSGMVGTAWGILWIEEMRAFRRDARFQAFVERLGLVEYWSQYGPPDNCELRNGRLICS
jgi:TolB-like protein/DNA-binding winged helix-turn-helix (wHTH) protein/tetratricopeptide (TPR) repeat protein